MAKNNYLSHWDLDGNSVNDLRISYGIKTAIGENLAMETNLISAHEGLMRSALHRDNILDSHWTRAGFGFALNTEGSLFVVELFTLNLITESDVPALRDEVLEYVNSKRTSLLVPNASLTAVSQSWSDRMSDEENEFFDFTDLSGKTLNEEIREAGILSSVGTIILGNYSWADILPMIDDQTDLFATKWKKIGVGIKQDQDGIIKVTILYSD